MPVGAGGWRGICSHAHGFGVAVDGEGLAGDAGAAIGTEEENGCGDIVGSNQGAQGALLAKCFADFLYADAAGGGLGGVDAVDARSFDGAGADGVDADTEGVPVPWRVSW